MKLKYKLFSGFFIIIVLFSISLLLVLFQFKKADSFLRLRVDRDIQDITALSYQQHLLEKVYDQYLLVRIPSNKGEKYLLRLSDAVNNYSINWKKYTSFRNTESTNPFIDYIYNISNKKEIQNQIHKKKELEQICVQIWVKIHKELNKVTGKQNTKIGNLKSNISNLQISLFELSQFISLSSRKITRITQSALEFLQTAILSIITFMFFLSLAIAFFVARRLSKPLESLKRASQQIAIYNFDFKIKNKSNDEIGELASAFEQMALRLKKNDQFKNAILSQFSHEMKSPLGAVKQAAKLLESTLDENAGKDQKRLISIILGNNDILFRLINNILLSAEFEPGKIEVTFKRENIVKLLTTTLMLLSPVIKEKNIKVDLNFSSEKIDCEIDPEKIKEVFQNFISNAVKFSGNNSKITISLFEKHPMIIFKIRDEGIGIPANEIPYIFEKMYRATNSKKISVKGTGLGLYISSQILNAHGGRIKVNSTVAKGTEFIIELPKTRQIAAEREWK